MLRSTILSVATLTLFNYFPLLSQEVFFTNLSRGTLLRYNIERCQFGSEVNFKDFNLSLLGMSFHPDGRLYMLAEGEMIGFNVLTNEIDRTVAIPVFDYISSLAISEEGSVLISAHTEKSAELPDLIIEFDIRVNKTIDTISAAFGGFARLGR